MVYERLVVDVDYFGNITIHIKKIKKEDDKDDKKPLTQQYIKFTAPALKNECN